MPRKPLYGNDSTAMVLRIACVFITLVFLGFVLVLPLVMVFTEALSAGIGPYFAALTNSYTVKAIGITLLVAGIAVPLNVIFGLAASWAIAKFEFRFKSLLITLIDLPFSVSPVISGMVFVLLFGRRGYFGPWLLKHDIKIIYAVPGMVLATIFVTFPFVARELIPLMQEQGSEEELAAISLGASGWQTFWRITVPNVKWGLLYGVVLCTARAMGEFGAVAVVTASIIGGTNTLPLHIETLYSQNAMTAAFAVSTLLAAVGLLGMTAKSALEWKLRHERTRLQKKLAP